MGVGPSTLPGVLVRRDTQTHTGRRPWGSGSRDQSNTSMSHGMPRIASHRQKLRRDRA